MKEEIIFEPELTGMVREMRAFKWGGFFLLDSLNGSHTQIMQCVVKDPEIFSKLKHESYVRVTGEQVPAKVHKELVNSDYEFIVKGVEVLSEPSHPQLFNIYEKTIKADPKNVFDSRALSLRNETNKCVFKVQSKIQELFRSYLSLKNFVAISTPKIVSNGAEGGTSVFKLDYFGKEACLAQSPQLYKQIMVGVFGKVYEIAPVFRAEKHNTTRHLNEYLSMDCETALHTNGVNELIALHAKFMWSMLMHLNDSLTAELAYIGSPWREMNVGTKPISMKVTEAAQILGISGHDLSVSEEKEIGRYALETLGTDLLYLTNYHRDVRPFYTKLSSDGVTTESFDAIFRGIEITSGGQRKETYKEYEESMTSMNMDSFAGYLEAFKIGMPLHGGFAIGLERLTAKVCGLDSVKDATLFPRDVDRITP
jgi:nondiscriminating aspartyl-tRNA synthetase